MDHPRDRSALALAEPAPRLQASGREAQVFVDHSGWRARGVRVVGAGIAGLCALWLTGLVLGMAGFSGFPAGRLPFGRLPALARVSVARAEARELVSAPAVGRPRAVNAVNTGARSVCLSVSAGAAPLTRARRGVQGAGHRRAGRSACSAARLPAGHRGGSV